MTNDSAGWSAAPSGSGDVRDLWQRRLVFYLATSILLSSGHLLLSVLAHGLLMDEARWVWYQQRWGPRFELLAIVLQGGFWLVSRLRPWSLRALHTLDLALSFALGAGYTLIGYGFTNRGGPMNAQFLLPLALTLVLRAALLPVEARYTVLSSAVAFVPTLAFVHVVLPKAGQDALGSLTLVDVGRWGATIVATAGIVSYATFRLRKRVREVTRFGPYTLGEQIGAGGMGRVYRAHHALLRRPTAVKLLPPGVASFEDLQRFEREVQITAGLTHPNTVSIYDYGHNHEGVFYYAMEYIEGLTLKQVVEQDGPQSPARVIHVLRQVCGALEEAHAAGLVHRDIKPDNVLLCERGGVPDMVKVVDFGLAKDLTEAMGTSPPDAIAGTPMYMSPEALQRPPDVGPSADLYALGAVGYFLLTGRHVFQGSSVAEICIHHLVTTPTPPSKVLGRELPAELEALLLRCLAKDPGHRPPSASELDEALAACELSAPWDRHRAHVWWQHHPPVPTVLAGDTTVESVFSPDRTYPSTLPAVSAPTLKDTA